VKNNARIGIGAFATKDFLESLTMKADDSKGYLYEYLYDPNKSPQEFGVLNTGENDNSVVYEIVEPGDPRLNVVPDPTTTQEYTIRTLQNVAPDDLISIENESISIYADTGFSIRVNFITGGTSSLIGEPVAEGSIFQVSNNVKDVIITSVDNPVNTFTVKDGATTQDGIDNTSLLERNSLNAEIGTARAFQRTFLVEHTFNGLIGGDTTSIAIPAPIGSVVYIHLLRTSYSVSTNDSAFAVRVRNGEVNTLLTGGSLPDVYINEITQDPASGVVINANETPSISLSLFSDAIKDIQVTLGNSTFIDISTSRLSTERSLVDIPILLDNTNGLAEKYIMITSSIEDLISNVQSEGTLSVEFDIIYSVS